MPTFQIAVSMLLYTLKDRGVFDPVDGTKTKKNNRYRSLSDQHQFPIQMNIRPPRLDMGGAETTSPPPMVERYGGLGWGGGCLVIVKPRQLDFSPFCDDNVMGLSNFLARYSGNAFHCESYRQRPFWTVQKERVDENWQDLNHPSYVSVQGCTNRYGFK